MKAGVEEERELFVWHDFALLRHFDCIYMLPHQHYCFAFGQRISNPVSSKAQIEA